MKLIHFSDPHMLALRGAPLHKLLSGKRLFGYANILLRRGHQHRFDTARAVLREIRKCNPDHVAVTGDVSNLGLETELAAAAQWLREDLGFDPERVSFVPGNHDAYTRRALSSDRFSRHFGLPPRDAHTRWAGAGAAFPYLKPLGPVALVGLDSAVPQPPFVAAGRVSENQLRALAELMADSRVRDRLPVILVHHPVLYERSRLHRWLRGLRNAEDVLRAVAGVPRVVFLHGHLHRWVALRVSRGASEVLCIGAASASRVSTDPERCAGFTELAVSAAGEIQALRAHTLDPVSGRFDVRDLHVRTYRQRA